LQPLLTNVKEYTVKDIANLLPIGDQQIRRYIAEGSLKVTMKRGRWYATQKDLEAFMLEKGFTNLNL